MNNMKLSETHYLSDPDVQYAIDNSDLRTKKIRIAKYSFKHGIKKAIKYYKIDKRIIYTYRFYYKHEHL